MLDTRTPRNARQHPNAPAHFRGNWTEQLTPVDVARAYRLAYCVDYGPDRAGEGLLVTTGAGLLMADMDQLPTCRYAIDIGANRGHPRADSWSLLCGRLVSHTVAHLWMAITDPGWMRDVLAPFPRARLAVASSPALNRGHHAAGIDELAAWADQFRSRPC